MRRCLCEQATTLAHLIPVVPLLLERCGVRWLSGVPHLRCPLCCPPALQPSHSATPPHSAQPPLQKQLESGTTVLS